MQSQPVNDTLWVPVDINQVARFYVIGMKDRLLSTNSARLIQLDCCGALEAIVPIVLYGGHRWWCRGSSMNAVQLESSYDIMVRSWRWLYW